jgi:hypothetical protein
LAPPALPGFFATMTLSETQVSRDPIGRVWSCLHWLRASPNYTDGFLRMPCSLPRWIGLVRVDWVIARSRAGLFPKPLWPSRNERPVGIHNFPFEACSSFTHLTPAEDQGPALSRDKVSVGLRLWSGLRICSPTYSGLCHEAPVPMVTHRNGPSAIQAYRQLLVRDFHPPVICAVGARVRFAYLYFSRRIFGAKGELPARKILSCQGPVGRVSEHLAVREIGPGSSFFSGLSIAAVKWFGGDD